MKKSTRFKIPTICLLLNLVICFCYSSLAQYNPLPASPPPPGGIGYLDNGTVKIGVDLAYGGAVTYFSKSNSTVNTVNNSDHGRQMQWAVYSGPDNFSQNSPDDMWKTLGWNPIEAGDCKNNAPSIITYANNGTTIYTKLQPYHWPLLTTYAECYFEKWITLDGNAARVHFRFTSFRSDQTVYYERRQELPCLYTHPQYSRHVFYDGNNPWVNAPVTNSTNSAYTLNQTSENWMAMEQPGTGDAVALWGKDHYDWARLIVGDAGYFAVEPKVKFYPGKVEDWDAAIIAGTIPEIRSWVYAQPRPADKPDWNFNGTRNRWNTYDMDEAGTPTTQWDLSVIAKSDWNLNSPTVFFKATDVPKIYVTAAFSLDNVTSMGIGWNRNGQGAGNILQLNQYTTFPIINDGQYHTYEVNMSGHPNWSGGIQQLLLIRNPSITGPTTGTVKIRSISYQGTGIPPCTPPSAPAIAVTGSTTTTCADGSRTVMLTASGCSGGTITWSNGQTGNTLNVTTAGSYTATCTVNNCISSVSNTVTISNGTDCGGSSPNPPGNYGGSFDGGNCDYINGWAWNGSNHRVVLEVIDGSNNDAIITEIVADTYRNDLQSAGIGDGIHSFWISTPAALKNGQNHNVKIRVKGIGTILPNSPKTINCAGSGCSTPAAPTLSASATSITSGQSTTLSASGCSGGTINWSNSLGTGSSKTVSPTTTTTYTATCTVNDCTSGNGSVTITVTTGGGSGSLNQCIEAESSSGNGSITSDPNASNGQTRGDENNNNHYVDYVVTGVPSAGTYYAKLRYYSSAVPVVTVTVNGGSAQTVTLSNTHTWNIVSTETTIPVSLGAGTNTIRIQGTSGGSCRQDRLCVSNNSGSAALLGIDPAELVEVNKRFVILPNPNKGVFQTNFFLEKGKKATLMVSDIQGRTIYSKQITGQGMHNERINLANKASGTLFLQLKKDTGTDVKKLTIVR